MKVFGESESVAELEEQFDQLVVSMLPRQRRYAENLLQVGTGKAFATQVEAYRAAGYKVTSDSASGKASRLAGAPAVREFLSLASKIALRRAMEAVGYDETQWLWDAVAGMNMALGREPVVVTDDKSGAEIMVRNTDLKSAARYTEILGKRLGLLTEKKLVGEDPDKPLNSIRELASIMGSIANEAQAKGPVRDE